MASWSSGLGLPGLCSEMSSTKQESSFPNKALANLTPCSSYPSTPPTLPHDPASQTTTFTQCTQLASQLHTTTASTARYVLCPLLNPPTI